MSASHAAQLALLLASPDAEAMGADRDQTAYRNVTGNKRASLSERQDDLYETPPEAVRALLAVEDIPSAVWEPACGPGAIVRELRATGRRVYATDLVDYASPDQDASGRDFLLERQAPIGATCILTNPPFKNTDEFAAHALTLVPKVVMLMRLAFLESERRRKIIDESPLARIHVFRDRLPMMHRHGWQGPRASSAMAFAWFVWESAHVGPPTLRRVSWQRHHERRPPSPESRRSNQ